MSGALLCFGATFIAVFALGLQSLNVNQGHYWAAAVTSLLISVGHIALYKFMPGADLVEVGGYLVGGVAGITSSMWFHRRVRTWWQARREVRLLRPNGQPHRAQPWPPPPTQRRDEHADTYQCGWRPPTDTH